MVANDREHCVLQRDRPCLGRRELSVTFLKRADMTSRCEVALNGRADGSSAGSADVSADLTISWRFEACRAGAPGAQNHQWEEASFFEITPGYSGLSRFFTNRRKPLSSTRRFSCAELPSEIAVPEDRRRKIAC
jgi:hypothetical protein